MSVHPFDTLTLANGAKIIFTPCPGTKEASITDAVSTLKTAGASLIISVMFDEELAKLNAATLSDVTKEQNVQWLQWPISDEAGPDAIFETAFNKDISTVLEALANQQTIAVHCKGGSGRTGLAIALILKSVGLNNDDIVTMVQTIRPKALKHPVQLAYFEQFIPFS